MAAIALLVVAPPNPARAEYALAPGDVLEISVSGFPDLRQRPEIDADGNISLAPTGIMHVRGLLLSEVISNVRHAYANTPLRLRGADGRQNVSQIYPDEVAVRVAEYRPIYIVGDVAKPGPQAYRAPLTVERAIALAGGVDPNRSRSKDFVLERADLEAEREVLRTETETALAAVQQLKLELDGKSDVSDKADTFNPGEVAKQSNISEVVYKRLRTRQSDSEDEMSSIERRLGQVKLLVKSVEQQSRQAKDLYNSQAALMETLRRSAAMPPLQVFQSQRELGAMLERMGQVDNQLAQARRDEEELSRQLRKVREQHRIHLLTDLEDSFTKLQTNNARQNAIENKLSYLGGLGLGGGRVSDADARASINRDGINQSIQADARTAVLPGDVVRITIQDRTRGDKSSFLTGQPIVR
jgi:polysaccharide export outer membrane protein